jgi:LigD, primase-polymerase domain
MAAAYSVRGFPNGTVSTPIRWNEIDDVEPGDCTMQTVPRRFAELGDLHAGIDDAVFAIDELLEWARRDEHAGAVDAGVPDEENQYEWYQSDTITPMAMTLRLTADEQAALRERAAAEGISMQDAARRAVREYVARGAHRERVEATARTIMDVHADALRRLGE